MDTVDDTLPRTDEIAQAIQRIGRLEAELPAIRSLLLQVRDASPSIGSSAECGRPLRYVKVCDGQKKIVDDHEYSSLVPEEFHFFLDLAGGRLLTKVGSQRPALRMIAQTTLQSEDIRTLAFLVEHADRDFGADNLAEYLDQEALEANTLSRRMVRIRREVQQGRLDGPFIERATNVDLSISRSGFGFRFTTKKAKHYCLIRFARPMER